MKPYGGGKPVFNTFLTPIGLIAHLYHDAPQLKTKDQNGQIPDIDPETGIQKAEYKVTLAWSKTRVNELQDLINLAMQTQAEAWPDSVKPGAFFQLEPFFRDGDNPAHNTKNKEYLRDRYYLNFKQKADAKRDAITGKVVYSGAPGLLGPYGPEDLIMPMDIWPGCTGRVSGIMFGTEYAGRNFISVRLNNIQKYDEGDGTRIGGGSRPTAAQQFGALKDGQGGQFPNGNAGMFGLGQPQGNAFAGAGMGTLGSTGNAGGAALGGNNGNMFGNAGTNPQQNPFGNNQFGNAGGRTII